MGVFDVTATRLHTCEIAGETFKVKDLPLALAKEVQEAMEGGQDGAQFSDALVLKLFRECLRDENGEPFPDVQTVEDLQKHSTLLITQLVFAILEANQFDPEQASAKKPKTTGPSTRKSR